MHQGQPWIIYGRPGKDDDDMKAPSLTLGIEEEYQIIDPETRELRSYITQILEEGRLLLREQVKPELHQSIVEIGSSVCQTPAEIRTELVRLRRTLIELAGKNGLKIAAAGTHPHHAPDAAGMGLAAPADDSGVPDYSPRGRSRREAGDVRALPAAR